jgi:hypothetical protein
MKSALTALCMLALIPVATLASEIPAADETLQARCLQNAAAGRASDSPIQARLHNVLSQMIAPPMDAGFHNGYSARFAGSLIHPSVRRTSACLRPEKHRAAAQRTSEPRRLWKTGPR